MELSPDRGRAAVPSDREGVPPFVEIDNQLLALIARLALVLARTTSR